MPAAAGDFLGQSSPMLETPSSGKWFRILGEATTGTRATRFPDLGDLFLISVERPIARHDEVTPVLIKPVRLGAKAIENDVRCA